MISDKLKRELVAKKLKPNENIGKLVGRLHRYIQIWYEEKNPNRHLYRVKPSLPALLSNINTDGGSNKELAHCAFISKQAMSKLLNETVKDGIVEIVKSKDDSRVNNIALTDKGAEVLISIWENNQHLIENFEKHLGKEKTKTLLALLTELSESLDICGK